MKKKMKETIFCITGYLPFDESEPCVNIYQLLLINDLYYWACVTDGGGIGFSTSNPGKSEVDDAFISLHEVVLNGEGILSKVGKMNIYEAVEKAKEFSKTLS